MTALLIGMLFGATAATVGLLIVVIDPLRRLLAAERGRTTKYRRAATTADWWTRLWPRTAAKDW